MVKRYAAGGASSDTRPVQNAPKYTITPKKPVSKAEAPKPKPTPKPTPKPAAKKPATKSGSSYSAVKDIKSRMVPNTGVPKPGVGVKATSKPKPKPAAKTPAKTPAKPAAKTVSQLWTEKTGTSWSEAKKQGLSDGSFASNMALMKKLQSGSINKETIAAMKDNSKVPTLSAKDTTVTKSSAAAPAKSETKSESKPTVKQMSGSGMGAMERMEGMYKKGGSVKKKMKSKNR